MKAALFGEKIDIPDIWKGSSANTSQTVTITLHCVHPNDDDEFDKRIAKPLLALFSLACPYTSGEGGGGGGGGGNNDIITFENPPYIEAYIDGLWCTKLGGVTNMSVRMNYKDQSYVKAGRPLIVTVELTMSDMYNAIVWTENAPHNWAPTGNGIVKNIVETDKDSIQPELSEIYKEHLYPLNGDSDWDGTSYNSGGGGGGGLSSLGSGAMSTSMNSGINNGGISGYSSTSGLNSALSASGINTNAPYQSIFGNNSSLGNTSINDYITQNFNVTCDVPTTDSNLKPWYYEYLGGEELYNGNCTCDLGTSYCNGILSDKNLRSIADQELLPINLDNVTYV